MQFVAKKFILTKEGLSQLKEEYEELISVKRPQIAKRIQRAREFGDLAENSEYDAAKEEQSLLEHRITELEGVLAGAEIVEQTEKSDVVVIGSQVVVEMNNEIHEFSLVGSMEADPTASKISNESPVGQALIGLKAGESTEVAVGPVKTPLRVLEVR
jgi:transcription elongation factor GreA